MSKAFQCSKRHRWHSEKSDCCPVCSRKSEDLVAKSSDMCPSCAVRGQLWLGVSGLSYCDHCGFEWDASLSQIDRLQKILDFKKNKSQY